MKLIIKDKYLFENRPKLPEKSKQNWLSALRSGDYKKGCGYLCCNDKYCCLGVYLDINNVPYEIDKPNEFETLKKFKGNIVGLESGFPDFGVLGDFGRFKEFYIELNNIKFTSLAKVNDYFTTFDEVIEIIEKYF